MDETRARELVAAERVRIDAALDDLTGGIRTEGSLESQQTGERRELGTDVAAEEVRIALLVSLREESAAVDRAMARIDAGTFGRSIESGDPIPDARLEAAPLAERTVEEQEAFEHGGA
ncbi:MAG: hypothetical protein ABIR11_02400 [Candidatus Limnocylindrales bacterium]